MFMQAGRLDRGIEDEIAGPSTKAKTLFPAREYPPIGAAFGRGFLWRWSRITGKSALACSAHASLVFAGVSQAERLAQLGLDLRCGRRVAGRSRVSVEGIGVVGLEYLEPFGGFGGSFDDPESGGGVEQAGLQDLGFLALSLGVVAAVGEDDVDAGERAVLTWLELRADEGVRGAQCWGDQLGVRVAEQVGGVDG